MFENIYILPYSLSFVLYHFHFRYTNSNT